MFSRLQKIWCHQRFPFLRVIPEFSFFFLRFLSDLQWIGLWLKALWLKAKVLLVWQLIWRRISDTPELWHVSDFRGQN